MKIKLAATLTVVDVQNDFMTGGAPAVPLPGEKLPAPGYLRVLEDVVFKS
jgi:nicotinamidase-related amidase